MKCPKCAKELAATVSPAIHDEELLEILIKCECGYSAWNFLCFADFVEEGQ